MPWFYLSFVSEADVFLGACVVEAADRLGALGRVAIVRAAVAGETTFAVDADGGLRDQNGVRLFIERKMRMGQG